MASITLELLRRRFGGSSGYVWLESISNGVTAGQCAVMPTALVPDDANWAFVGSYMRTGAMGASYVGVMSAYTSEQANCYRIIRNASQDDAWLVNAYSKAGGGSTMIAHVNSLNTWYDYELKYGELVLNNVPRTLVTPQGSGTMTGQLTLCNTNFPQRIREFKAYHNGNLVAQMKPCKRKSDGVVGMYDIVRGQFFTSSNQYNFTE